MPAHEHHRFVVVTGESQLAAQLPVRRVEHLVLRVGDLALRQVERTGDGNPVHGPFVVVAVAEAGRGQQCVGQRPVVSHQEPTSLHAPQPYARSSGQGMPSKIVHRWQRSMTAPVRRANTRRLD